MWNLSSSSHCSRLLIYRKKLQTSQREKRKRLPAEPSHSSWLADFLVNLTLPELEQHNNLSFTLVAMSQVIRVLSIKKSSGPNSILGLWNHNLRDKSGDTELNLSASFYPTNINLCFLRGCLLDTLKKSNILARVFLTQEKSTSTYLIQWLFAQRFWKKKKELKLKQKKTKKIIGILNLFLW